MPIKISGETRLELLAAIGERDRAASKKEKFTGARRTESFLQAEVNIIHSFLPARPVISNELDEVIEQGRPEVIVGVSQAREDVLSIGRMAGL